MGDPNSALFSGWLMGLHSLLEMGSRARLV